MSLTPTNQSSYIFKTPVSVLATGTVTSSTEQTSSFQVEGGLAVAKNMIVGDTVYVGGTAEFRQESTFRNDVIVDGAVTSGITVDGTVVPTLYSNNLLVASYTSPVLTSTSTVTLDVFSANVYRTAKYTIQIVSGTKIHATEIMLTHDGSEIFITEYGMMTTDNELGTFDATLASQTVSLKFTPTTAAATTVKVVRIGITL